MTDVIAWPPVGLTAWELADSFPQSRSVSLIGGNARTSSALRERRIATATVLGRGIDQAGAGYVRMLNRLWHGKPRLTRVQCLSAIWHLAANGLDLRSPSLNWDVGSADLLWSSGESLLWGAGPYVLTGVPGTDAGWPALVVSGLPPSVIVVRPSETVTVRGSTLTTFSRALTVTRSNAAGVATIRLETAIMFAGAVAIGRAEDIVFEAIDQPRAAMPVRGEWAFSWDFREVFADEYPDGWVEVEPWRSAGV